MSGSALGRLLNLADGILGQNSKAMFLLTTNEPIGTLHPALTRPGRALSQVEFVPFTVAEANKWLDDAAVVTSPKSLAELYEIKGGVTRIHEPGLKLPIGFQPDLAV